MSDWLERIMKIEEEMKDSGFCGGGCYACGGDANHCIIHLILNIRDLQHENAILINDLKPKSGGRREALTIGTMIDKSHATEPVKALKPMPYYKKQS